MNIKKYIKKIIGIKEMVIPIYECGIISTNFESSCGGSLEGKNILLLTNTEALKICFETKLKVERCLTKSCYIYDSSNISYLPREMSKEMIGPFDVIFNAFDIGCNELISDVTFRENTCDGAKMFYQLNQKESDYLICHNVSGHIVNVWLNYVDHEQGDIVSAMINSMTEGLGLALGKHGIIMNGVCSDNTVSIEKVVQTGIFMSSMYGASLAGTVINLNEGN